MLFKIDTRSLKTLSKNLNKMSSQINSGGQRSLRQIGRLLAKDIKNEMRKNDKKGRAKAIVFRGSPARRSAKYQAAARDTGLAEKNIHFNITNSSLDVGFKEFIDPKSGESNYYMKLLEEHLDRPTLQIVKNQNADEIQKIIRKNINL